MKLYPMTQQGPSRPIIILGVDRSGTSVVANLVHEWGAYGGDLPELTRNDAFNPRGYWEQPPMVRFVQRIFQEVGHEFWRPGFAEALESLARNPSFRQPAEKLVSDMAVAGRPWFWKEPLLCLQLPFWKDIWGDASYIVTVRNPYDSAVSWQNVLLSNEIRERISIVALNLLRWQYFMLSILRCVDGSPHVLFVSFEDLFEDPLGQSVRLRDFLDKETGNGQPAADRAERMARAIDPSLGLNRARNDFSQVELATPEQKALYGLMRRKVEHPDAPFDSEAYPMYPGWGEYMNNFIELIDIYDSTRPIVQSPPVRFYLAMRQRLASLLS